MFKRILCGIITCALIIGTISACQNSVTSSDSSSSVSSVEETSATTEQTEEETSSPETTAEETSAPETTVEETKAPDTSAEETNPPASNDTPGEMRDITSQQLVDEMKIGWNLGNTLDVCQADRNGDGNLDEHAEEGEKVDETLWGNVMTTPELFDALLQDGINSVRIPVTWRDHIDDEGNIDTEWMDRVQQVVDYAIDRDMYVIINLHHDGGGDPNFGAWIRTMAVSDYDAFYARFSNMWKQIAERFKNYSDKLIFECMNEVGFDDLDKNKAYDLLNKINQNFVDIIRSTGGNNPQRHLLISGYWTDIKSTCDSKFKMPTDPANRMILSVHYYTPWDFCTVDIKHTWGTDSEKKEMKDLITMMYDNYVKKGTPVIIGEYGVSGSDVASCELFIETLNQLCKDYGIAAYFWDNGEHLNRTTFEWKKPGFVEAMQRVYN